MHTRITAVVLSIVIIMWSLPQDLVLISYAAPTEKTEDFESFTMGNSTFTSDTVDFTLSPTNKFIVEENVGMLMLRLKADILSGLL